ncbi:MAG: M15 family metallopeptidase [Polyangiaceae bacterium]
MIQTILQSRLPSKRLRKGLLFLLLLPMGCSSDLLALSKSDPLDGGPIPNPPSSSKSAAPASNASDEPSRPHGNLSPSEIQRHVPGEVTAIEQDAANPKTIRCREQAPQDFLVRAHINHAPKDRSELAQQRRLRRESIAYRTKQYGYVKGFGNPVDNAVSPRAMSEPTTFFDHPVVLNRRIIPALKCVEERLKSDCANTPYSPTILSGLRRKNTYFDGEVSNHVYGIAIDIDPEKNPCCKCVSPWNKSERCQGERTPWERMSMPRCWVEVFERFGFYWLGHDVLEDTMHFEFLGDPDRISE